MNNELHPRDSIVPTGVTKGIEVFVIPSADTATVSRYLSTVEGWTDYPESAQERNYLWGGFEAAKELRHQAQINSNTREMQEADSLYARYNGVLILLNIPFMRARAIEALPEGANIEIIIGALTDRLSKLIKHYDRAKGFEFSAYATGTLRGAAKSLFAREQGGTSMSIYHAYLSRYNRAIVRLVNSGIALTPENIAESSGLSLEVAQAIHNARVEESLDAPIGEPSEGLSLANSLELPEEKSVIRQVLEHERRVTIVTALQGLAEKFGETERDIVIARFVHGIPRKELTTIYGRTVWQIEGIETKARRFLADSLRDYQYDV